MNYIVVSWYGKFIILIKTMKIKNLNFLDCYKGISLEPQRWDILPKNWLYFFNNGP